MTGVQTCALPIWVQELLRLTRNTDLCTPVHFDFNHEHIVVEEKKDSADRFQIKCYF